MARLREWRIKRLAKAAEAAGGKAALGRLLGYKDGAYIGQMIRGDRPITEELVAHLEGKAGFSRWFSDTEAPPPPAPPPAFADDHRVPPEDWEFFQACKIMMSDHEKNDILGRYRALQKFALEQAAQARVLKKT